MFDFNSSANAIQNNQTMLNSYFQNLQNQFTPGYKAETVQFNDIMGQTMGVGGAKSQQSGIIFSQGQLFQTENPTNLAIDGQGFFMVNDGNQTHYTRDGRFSFNNGMLTNTEGKNVMGYKLDAMGNVTSDPQPIELQMDPETHLYGGKYTGYHFDETGKLYGEQTITDPTTGQTVTESVPLYQVSVASFANASGLKKTGTTTFGKTENSGEAVVGVAGQGAMGRVAPGSLELANVDFAQQAAAIGMAKQNYEANFAAFKAMDKLTESAIGLVR
ncbi:MAG: flagellar hook basal-body protein [bacterium]|nr:flagellar hook basal-body protein [bacterium]